MGNQFGQVMKEGTLIANLKASKPFSIVIQSAQDYDATKHCKISLKIKEKKAEFCGAFPGKDPAFTHAADENSGYEEGKKVSYWFSFNRDAREVKYGKGYIMEETTLLTHTFDKLEKNKPDPWTDLFDIAKWKYFKLLDDVDSEIQLNNDENTLNYYPYPLINNWPYLVKDSATTTIFDIASDKYILSACLPATCQELYAMVASPSVNLDSALIEAIDYSLNLENGFLSSLLDHKKNGNEDKESTSSYLRVTLGNLSCHESSPGVPFILELWPSGTGSRIHNHGNAYGIVKVLHGEIVVEVFNKTWPQPKETEEDEAEVQPIGDPMRLVKGDVAWLSPNWYQTHRMTNKSTGYCATIQCYKYDDDCENISTYPFVSCWEKSETQEFKPDSDLDFIKMVEKVLKEFNEQKKNKC